MRLLALSPRRGNTSLSTSPTLVFPGDNPRASHDCFAEFTLAIPLPVPPPGLVAMPPADNPLTLLTPRELSGVLTAAAAAGGGGVRGKGVTGVAGEAEKRVRPADVGVVTPLV